MMRRNERNLDQVSHSNDDVEWKTVSEYPNSEVSQICILLDDTKDYENFILN